MRNPTQLKGQLTFVIAYEFKHSQLQIILFPLLGK